MDVSIVIPTLNEAETIGGVIASIPAINGEILVVDSSSTDGTPVIAKAAGAKVIHEPRRGYGRACAAGVAAARGAVVVFLDADGADNPEHLPKLLKSLHEENADMVLGSRLTGQMEPGAMPWHQHFGNWLSARLINHFYDLQLTDLSPFRAVLREKLLTLKIDDLTFGWPTEMVCKAACNGWRIVEVPVSYHPRAGGKSKISGTLRGTVLATYHILHTILRYQRFER